MRYLLGLVLLATNLLGASKESATPGPYTFGKKVSVVVPIHAGVYAVGDQIGDKFRIPKLLDKDSRSGFLMSIAVINLENTVPNVSGVRAYFFSQEPQTIAGDNNVFSVSDSDLQNFYVGSLIGNSGTFAVSALNSVGTRPGSVFLGLHTDDKVNGVYTGDMWCVLRLTGGPVTFVSTNSLIMNYFAQ